MKLEPTINQTKTALCCHVAGWALWGPDACTKVVHKAKQFCGGTNIVFEASNPRLGP